MAEAQERLEVKGSKGLIVAIVSLLLGGGAGVATSALGRAEPAPAPRQAPVDLKPVQDLADATKALSGKVDGMAETLESIKRDLALQAQAKADKTELGELRTDVEVLKATRSDKARR